MIALIRYARNRYEEKSLGFGLPWFKWLWLDACMWALARYRTRCSPFFWLWCHKVDRIFSETYDWPRSYVADTGADGWIDYYWNGDSPNDAVSSEVSYW